MDQLRGSQTSSIKTEFSFQERLASYSEDHCWQYNIRVNNLKQDLEESGLSEEYTNKLRVPDFEYRLIDSKEDKRKAIDFIKKHEWLGNITQFTTHWFICCHKDIIAGVILLSVPNAFSKMLGEDTPQLERLISRGACISWSPKNLASSFLMWCLDYMAKNTSYRLFTAYSDPTAKELGTIYQACNFYYIGQKSGTAKRYINPYSGKMVSDRFFRQKTAYKKFAKEMDIEWGVDWNHKTGMNWHLMPDDIEKKLRDYSKKKQSEAECFEFPPKHKYAYIIGEDKRETKMLRRKFLEKNKTFPYPKERGK